LHNPAGISCESDSSGAEGMAIDLRQQRSASGVLLCGRSI
jgi:hypothetical protein